MCDVQILRTATATYFAKNSDREPEEPQTVVRLSPVTADRAKTVRTTYLAIPQTSKRHGIVLSQPAWLWGGEMGANDQGVVIGNTAIFTKLRTLEPGLVGMDLLRLALERAASADEAIHVIAELLMAYGQGGPAGFRNKKFCYDNSFIVADAKAAWVLETAGRYWAAKKVEAHAAISNCMTIGEEFDLSSPGLADAARQLGWLRRGQTLNFRRAFETKVMPVASGARRRVSCSLNSLATATEPSLAAAAAWLRQHWADSHTGWRPKHNHDVCMHAGSIDRPSQTTAAMVSRLTSTSATHAMTGTSATCVSIFKPVACDDAGYGVLADAAKLWVPHAILQAKAELGLLETRRLQAERNEVEAKVWAEIAAGRLHEADRLAMEWQDRWLKQSDMPKGLRPRLRPGGRAWRRRLNYFTSLP